MRKSHLNIGFVAIVAWLAVGGSQSAGADVLIRIRREIREPSKPPISGEVLAYVHPPWIRKENREGGRVIQTLIRNQERKTTWIIDPVHRTIVEPRSNGMPLPVATSSAPPPGATALEFMKVGNPGDWKAKWPCHAVEMRVSGVRQAEFCLARGASLEIRPEELALLGAASLLSPMPRTGSEVPEVIVSRKFYVAGKVAETSGITEISRKALPMSLFSLPEGYSRIPQRRPEKRGQRGANGTP